MKANPLIAPVLCRALVRWLPIALLPMLTSCIGTIMSGHFEDYSTAYGDALNHQMLLNLARLENGHPAYFLVIGAIDDRITVTEQAGIGSTGNFNDANSAVHAATKTATTSGSSALGYSANGNILRTSNPEFQFIPLNNDAVAKQVLQPIVPEVFYTLYQQGYPIDQLMRVMIERVETTLPNGQQLVLVNSPTRGTPESYARFLRACAILRQLQLIGCLSLQATNQPPERVGPVSFGAAPKPGAGDDKAGPSIKDYSDAQDKGWTLTQTNNGWQLGQLRETPVFIMNTNVLAANEPYSAAKIDKNLGLVVPQSIATYLTIFTNSTLSRSQQSLVPILVQSLTNSGFAASNPKNADTIADDVVAVCTVIDLLNDGISIQTKVSGEAHARTRLVLRSFGRAMEAVASEQPPFDALAVNNHQFAFIVPDLEKHPVIRIDWSGDKERLVYPVHTVDYAGKTYEVTDTVTDPLSPNATWNRDVFRLLIALSSQVTVDISKFQQQVFELRTQ
jgi:hypothetical protein